MTKPDSLDIRKQFSLIIKLPVLAFALALITLLLTFEYRASLNENFFRIIDLEKSILNHELTLSKMMNHKESHRFLKSKAFENNSVKLEKLNHTIHKASSGKIDPERLKEFFKQSDLLLQATIENGYNIESSERFNQLNQSPSLKYKSSLSKIKLKLGEKKKKILKKSDFIRQLSVLFILGLGLTLSLFVYFNIRKRVHSIAKHYNQLIFKKEKQKEELLEASNSKDLFLANMSHEIRTPLGAIIGFANLAYEDPSLEHKTKENIGFVKRNSEHLLSLIEDLFDLTKIGNDKLDLNLENCDLFETLDDIKKIFEEKVHESNKTLDFKINGDLPRQIVTDQLRFKQILTNLIGNAVKFTPPGKKITCLIENVNGNLEINIIDEGIGIDKTKVDLIYDSFEQVDAEHSRVFGGAGLGLSISKNLTHLLNGRLNLIWSEKGKGSHFRLTFPIKSVGRKQFSRLDFERNVDKAHQESEKFTLDLSNALLGKKVLIAEDSTENQILFRIFIESAGAKVTLVENGKAAVKEALSSEYDVTLMDIQMPGMDGFQALKILRDSGYKGKVIALTAHALKGDRNKALASGFDGYLSKPVSKERLVTSVFEQF